MADSLGLLYNQLASAVPILSRDAASIRTRSELEVYAETFQEVLEATCNTLLCPYDPLRVQCTRALPEVEEEEMNMQTSSKIFKRLQRTMHDPQGHTIESREPTKIEVERDVEHFYSQLFGCDKRHHRDIPRLHQSHQQEPQLARATSAADSNNPAPTPSRQHIKRLIIKYSTAKSPGKDGIDARILHTLARNDADCSFLSHMTTLFTAALQHASVPESWKTSVIHLLRKDDNKPFNVSNARPISLLPVIRRLFEQMLLESVVENNVNCSVMNSGQAGFRKGFSTLSQLLVSHAATRARPVKVFIDLKNAWLHTTLASLFTDIRIQLVVNRQLSPPLTRSIGLCQGSPLAPWLFNVFINDLAETINGNNGSKDTLFSPIQQQPHLQRATTIQMYPPLLLNTISDWCAANSMAINVSKSGYIIKNIAANSESDVELSQVDRYKYLGVEHDHHGLRLDRLIQRQVQKANNMLKFLQASKVAETLQPRSRLLLYKAYVRSMVEYAAPLYAVYLSAWGVELFPGTTEKEQKHHLESLEQLNRRPAKHSTTPTRTPVPLCLPLADAKQ